VFIRQVVFSLAKNGAGPPAARKERTPSGRFMDTINPLLSFSMDEIESMGHEVDDICNESESSSTDEEDVFADKTLRRRSSRSKSNEQSLEMTKSMSELNKNSSSNSSSSKDYEYYKLHEDHYRQNSLRELNS